MAMTLREGSQELVSRDAELQRLCQEHSRYEEELDQLSKSPYVSAENLLHEATLKKLKLRVKDEMEKRLALLSKSPLFQ